MMLTGNNAIVYGVVLTAWIVIPPPSAFGLVNARSRLAGRVAVLSRMSCAVVVAAG